jgi:ABC-type arginine/histidine transport system permease subunit
LCTVVYNIRNMAEKSCTIKTLVFPGPIPFTSWLMVYPGKKKIRIYRGFMFWYLLLRPWNMSCCALSCWRSEAASS